MSDRKAEESKFHDMLRSEALREDPERYSRYTANRKFYSITRKSRAFFESWLVAHAPGQRLLDYGCGDGRYAILAAQHGADVVGIDLSEVSVENARREARRQGVNDRTTFLVMDGEALEFDDNSFDVVCEAGVLHHVDLGRALTEIARVLKPSGRVMCAEALGHNPLFQAYRRLTPHLRTRWETDHILRRHDVRGSHRWFRGLELHFFHLTSLVAVSFRNTRAFGPLLSAFERIDEWVLRVPWVQWYAWQIIYVLSDPFKD